MKKYSKPILHTDVVDNISEPVFLASGRGWLGSECYTSYYHLAQGWEESRQYYVYQADIDHDCDITLAQGKDTVPHYNEGQYTILTFQYPMPSGVSGYIYDPTGDYNTWPLTWNEDRTKARAVTGWHNNGHDSIGLGNVQIYLNGLTTAEMNSVWITSIEMYDDGCYPNTTTPFRIRGYYSEPGS